MKLLISGASGVVGRALRASLLAEGHEVHRLVRREVRGGDEVYWDPAAGAIDAEGCEGFDAVIHLAGESIAGKRWNPRRKLRMLESRTEGTRLLSEALARAARPPGVLVSASAIGYYGNRGDEVLEEGAAQGTGFLAEVCAEWEAATAPAKAAAGLRVVHLRIGLVLSPDGGALGSMLPVFRLGVGGRLGRGRQWMSWVGMNDLVRLVHHVLRHETVSGPVNAVSPEPVTNAEFTRILARVLSRPAFLPVPAFLLRLVFGEMADELLLSSARALPRAAQASGFAFSASNLETALRETLNR